MGTAVAGLSSQQWLDWSAQTNVQPISNVHPTDGLPTAWLESRANYPLTNWHGKAIWDSVTKQVIVIGAAQGLVYRRSWAEGGL